MADQFINDMSVTWNEGSTAFAAIKMNVTDAASSSAALLLDLQVGAASKFKVGKDGHVTLTSSDAGATAGPVLTLLRDSASPLASDIIGKLLFQGEDSAGNTEDYAEIYSTISDPTSTSEDASVLIRAKIAGTMTTLMSLSGTAVAIADSVFRVQDNADATKQLAFQVSGITTGNTRTITWPDRDVDVSKMGLDVIASGSVSAAATLEITGLSSTYRSYTIVFDNLLPATDNVALWVRLSTDNGANWDSAGTDYANARQVGLSDGSTEVGGSSGAAQIPILTAVGNATSRSVFGEIDVIAPATTGRTRVMCRASYFDSPGLYRDLKSSGTRTTNSAHNAVQILFSSGNIATMNYTVYGRRAA